MHHEAGSPASRRAEALTLLQDASLSVGEIARRLGVARQAVERWNREAGIRPRHLRRRMVETWPPARREAALRILAVAQVDPADLAEAVGFAREYARLLLSSLGAADRAGPDDDPPGAPGEGVVPSGRLGARLRAHIGRQIAVLDAALTAAPAGGIDSAKVLRDLGGLKRLLDDLGEGAAADDRDRGKGEPRDEPARSVHDESERDPDAIRAEIARRFERFVGGGAAE
jgi:transposase-like protein